MARANPRHTLPLAPRCYLCGMPLKLLEAQLDHVIPKSRGGRDGVGNRRWAHKKCNRLKGTFLLSELQPLCERIADYLRENMPV